MTRRTYEFPEGDYPAAPRFRADYERRVARGRLRAREARAAICGLARDLGMNFDVAAAGVEAVGGLFADWRAYIYENDSADGTRASLQAWAAQEPRVTAWTETRRAPRWGAVRAGERGTQMAEYRNACRDAAVAAGGFDYAVVLDTDLSGWSLDGVASTLGSDGWDAMGSNGLAVVRGRVVQYDAWAWRDLDHPGAMEARAVNPRVYDRGHPPVPVLSCFGGMAVYKFAAFAAARYAGGDCEHVPFHLAMAAAGHPAVFCNPGMVATYR